MIKLSLSKAAGIAHLMNNGHISQPEIEMWGEGEVVGTEYNNTLDYRTTPQNRKNPCQKQKFSECSPVRVD